MRRLPPLRSLEAFVRVVRLGSSKAAAGEWGLTPSALSRRIGQLEIFVGKKLFVRSHQQMKLNDAGEAFYDTVAPVLEDLADKIGDQIDAAIVLSEQPDAALHSVRLDHNRVYAITSRELASEIGAEPDVA